jgi:hypothetical protein
MRLTGLVLVVLLLCSSSAALAQDWTEYSNRQDRFSVNVAGEPQVRELSWKSEYGMTHPGRVYTFQRGPERYSITVIDYTEAEKRYRALDHPASFQQTEYWMIDIMGSIQYAATTQFRQRPGAKVSYDAWHYIDLVEGHQLHLTNADTTRTIAGIYPHYTRLYMVEATAPATAPEPALFVQSLSFLDGEGQRVRYDTIYSNKLPPVTMERPGRGGRGGRGGGGGGAAPAAGQTGTPNQGR